MAATIALEHIGELTVEDPGGAPRPLAAGSGLVLAGDHLVVVSDDAHDLAVWDLRVRGGARLVSAGRAPLPTAAAARKRRKPDLEALAALPHCPRWPRGALLALGSGSTPARMEALLWSLDRDGLPAAPPRTVDLAPLYAALGREVPDLNVEGATVAAGRLVLLQRGNGPAGVNAAVTLDLDRALDEIAGGALTAAGLLAVRRYDLGGAAGVHLAFTDAAALPGGRIAATAVAEAGESTYLDGACVGAALAVLGAEGELAAVHPLEPTVKVEGIAARPAAGGVELLMVADPDDPLTPSPVLRGRLDG